MMKRNTLIIGLLAALVLTFTVSPVLAQDKMTYEEYVAELERWQQREADAQAQIEQLEAEIAQLRADIDDLDAQIAAVWQDIYRMLGLIDEYLQTFAGELDNAAGELNEFEMMTPEEIYQNSDRLDEIQARLDEMSKHPAGALTQYQDILARLYAQLDSLRARMAAPKATVYTVVRGDYLWKISAMPEHFGDGMKWMRIYSVNHDQINDPDLIYPDQRFSIPLDIDKNKQYLVQHGEFLHSIADKIYNDPFQWRKLYEANREIIGDPNTIYPETILTVPER